MKRREVGFLAIGVVFGLLLGILLIGSSDGLRNSLFGTAGLTRGAEPAYFLADMSATEAWLASLYPEEAQRFETVFDNLSVLVDPGVNFREAFREVQNDIDLVVQRAFTALTGAVRAEGAVPAPEQIPGPILSSLSEGAISACLGLDENPYNLEGYALYLYVEVPSTQVQFMPETWDRLAAAKDSDLFWQLLACQSLLETQAGRSR